MAIFRNTITGNEMELHTQPGDFFIMNGQKWERVNNQSALASQVGGSHYKNFAIQPVEFIHRNGIGFIPGNIIKYVCRYGNKNGIEDLKKARHYLDMLIEMEGKSPAGKNLAQPKITDIPVEIGDTTAFGMPHHNHKKHCVYVNNLGYELAQKIQNIFQNSLAESGINYEMEEKK